MILILKYTIYLNKVIIENVGLNIKEQIETK